MKKNDILITVMSLIVFFAMMSIIALPNDAHAWSGLKQVSYYSGGTTASGKHITSKTHYVAVPISKVAKKSTWMKMSKANKKRYFYYGEKLKLRKWSKTKHKYYYDIVTVQDCGGFGRCGQYYKRKWCPRLFDLTPAVRKKLHISKSAGVGLVRYIRLS